MTLVLRLFLRRLIDNDVISPSADRHESLALLCALVVSFAVFVSFLISFSSRKAWTYQAPCFRQGLTLRHRPSHVSDSPLLSFTSRVALA